jgi:hypothetical protein
VASLLRTDSFLVFPADGMVFFGGVGVVHNRVLDAGSFSG